MKKLIKHFSLLTVLAVLFAVMTFTVYADESAQSNGLDFGLVFAPETQLVVYVDGQWSDTLSDSYGFGDTAMISAPENSGGKSFSHWEADGSVISYSRTLKLTMNAHTTLYAVYAQPAQAAQSAAGFTSITRTNDGTHISFQAIAAAKDVGAFTGAGILYSTTSTGEALSIGGTDVTNVPAVVLTDSTSTLPDSILDENHCWMLQIAPDSSSTVYHARTYVTTDAGITYGDVKNVTLSDLESGISLIANPGGFDLENRFEDLLAGLADDMHTVTFDANGGIGATITQAFLPGNPVALQANTYTNGDYVFHGWNTARDGSGTAYADGATVTLNGDITLYATWKYDAVITKEPTAKTLTYNGSEQELVNAGEAEGGTLYYALGDGGAVPEFDGTSSVSGQKWSRAIPKATEAGNYTVYYMAVGDANRRDSAVGNVTITIAKAAVENKTVAKTIEISATGVTDKSIDLKDYLVADALLKETAKEGIMAGYITPGSLNKTVFTYSVAANEGGLTGKLILTITSTNYEDYTITINFASAKKVTEVVIENENNIETAVGTVDVPDLSGFTDAQPETAVEVRMEVKPESAGKVKEKAGAVVFAKMEEMISRLFGGVDTGKVAREYLDIVVKKSVNGGAAQEVSDVNRVLEIAVGYDLTGKYNPVIVREHGATVSRFTKLSARPAPGSYQDGTFYVQGSGTTAKIFIYARYFSTYTIAYSTIASYQVTFDDASGNVSQVVVANGNRVTKPADPTRDGYDFAGWYMDGTDTAWNFDTVVTQDVTLKAHWSEKEKETKTDGTTTPDDEQKTEEQKTDTPENELRSAKTDDRLPAFPFWIALIVAGIVAVGAGVFFRRKKNEKKNPK